MRIFHVITAIQPGGAEFIVQLLAQYSRNISDEIYIIVVRQPKQSVSNEFKKQFYSQLRSTNASIIEMRSLQFPITTIIDALGLIKKYNLSKNDILHLHSDIPEFFGMFVKIFCNIRIIRTMHNTSYWSHNPLIGWLVETTLNGSIRVGVSHSAIEMHNQFLKSIKVTPKGKQLVIHNGIEPHQSDSKKPDELKLDPSKINLLFIGRLQDQKGPDILVNSINKLSNKYKTSILLHMIGEGNLRSKLEAQSVTMKLPIIFYGALHNARKYIRLTECTIIPSRFEGLALIGIEAVMENRPVIATNAPGLAEVFEGTSHDLVPHGNAELLAKAIEQMVDEPEKRKLCSETYRTISSKFTVEMMAMKYLDLYHEK